MRQVPAVLSVLGLVWAALPAQAAEVTLFGKKYNVVSESWAQTYKNGKAVVGAPEGEHRKANLFFVQGADPSQDRLFVAVPTNSAENVHQLFLLTGADASGRFTKDSATMTEFFGGAVEQAAGGRPVSVVWISDVNTGTKVDRNIATFNFDDGDGLNFFDLDTMSGIYSEDALLKITQPEEAPDPIDPGMPNGDFSAMAPGPNGTIVVVGRAAADEDGNRTHIEIGVIDPKQDKFFNVKTDLMQVTQDSPVKIEPQDPNTEPNAFIRVSDTEYWMIVSGDAQGGNDAAQSQFLFRVDLAFPADLSKAEPGSIKARVLAKENLLGTPLHASDGGVFGMAIGREVAGGRILYFADWRGNLSTATPIP